ncbi:MAG: hypothetical protein ABIU95_05860, partial [Burkholderiales bacterium]
MFVALLVLAPNAFGDWMLRPHPMTVDAPLEVEVLRANDTNQPINDPLPARLPARLRHGDASVDVTLERAEVIDAGMLAPGAFRKATYRVRLPADVHGAVEITLAGAPRSS